MTNTTTHGGRYLYENRFLSFIVIGAMLAGIAYALLLAAPKPAEEASAPAPAALETAAKLEPAEAAPATTAAEVAAPAATEPAATQAAAASLLDGLTPGEGGLSNLTLPTGTGIAISETGVESQLIAFLEDGSREIDKKTWFEFDRLGFDTGSANLTADSQDQVAAIAEILKAFPNAHIKIGGYTDNTGDPDFNLKLSDDRAKAVMTAIAAQGIAEDRLAAEGYGDQHPVASNDTEEGRAKNRRTALSVRQR